MEAAVHKWHRPKRLAYRPAPRVRVKASVRRLNLSKPTTDEEQKDLRALLDKEPEGNV